MPREQEPLALELQQVSPQAGLRERERREQELRARVELQAVRQEQAREPREPLVQEQERAREPPVWAVQASERVAAVVAAYRRRRSEATCRR